MRQVEESENERT